MHRNNLPARKQVFTPAERPVISRFMPPTPMPVISHQEGDEFARLHEAGHKLLERGKALASKQDRSAEEEQELAEINRQLREIDDWFTRTAR
jgi:hypothetical protein